MTLREIYYVVNWTIFDQIYDNIKHTKKANWLIHETVFGKIIGLANNDQLPQKMQRNLLFILCALHRGHFGCKTSVQKPANIPLIDLSSSSNALHLHYISNGLKQLLVTCLNLFPKMKPVQNSF